MVMVRNSGGELGFPEVRIPRGDKMVSPSVWSKLKKNRAVAAHLRSGSLKVVYTDDIAKEQEAKKPAEQPELPEQPSGEMQEHELSNMNAKDAASHAASLSKEDLQRIYKLESRLTAKRAIEAELAKLQEQESTEE